MSLMVNALSIFVAAICLATVQANAQPQPLRFEVASVRLSTGPETRGEQRITGARVDILGSPLRSVLLLAFGVADYQLDGPNWLGSLRVDIRATIPVGATKQQIPGMLETLLKERFALAARREVRPLDSMALVVSEAGAKMREVPPADDIDKSFPSRAIDVTTDTLNGPVRTVFSGLALTTLTQRTMYQIKPTERGTQILDAARMTMVELAALLEINIDKPVIDKTGLAGFYAFMLELPPHASVQRFITLMKTPNAAPTGVSTFSAVERLGLKLQPQRTPVDVVVIDRIERTPTTN
jgi:uncharacterized protein (TIGR03435 family)